MNEKEFNPNNPATADSGIFGLPYTVDEADLVLLPIPWEATVSYGSGTAKGPAAILEASMQVDLFHPLLPQMWTKKIAMADKPKKLWKLSNEARKSAEKIIDQLTAGKKADKKILAEVNDASKEMIEWVESKSTEILKQKKAVALVGGDHSTPLGLIQALSKENKFGILQIDAHCDLRNAYEGFEFSHASIMYNVLKNKNVTSLTQVGIRDYCEEEVNYINNSGGRINTFFDREIQYHKIEGIAWAAQCEKIIDTLPDKVYISFDIDGLTPDHCPNTGTPVPGGLSFAEVSFLVEKLAQSQKQIIGFDLNEVTPGNDDWDANVGARVLFMLCCAYFINSKK